MYIPCEQDGVNHIRISRCRGSYIESEVSYFAKLKYFYCRSQTSYADSEKGDLLIFFCHIYLTQT